MVRIAVQGCCHGELDKIFTAIKHIQKKENVSIDLLIICGDFQSIRNTADLESLACPEKYRSLGTFHHYYNKLKKPPCPVVFIGGNHEASNYLWELYHGGWVASDIYFMGFAGVINFGGLRIAGLSGIYKQLHYDCGHFESQPMVGDDMRSIYHVRKFNIFRLAQIKEPLDIFISHDWPRGIANHGNHEKLLSTKSFLAEELRTNTLGSIPNEFLLKRLKPTYWFAAHMHVLFAAIYEHNKVEVSSKAVTKNPDEIEIESDEEIDENGTENQKKKESVVKEEKATPMRKFTKFLALDKCVGDRSYLQIIDLPTDASEPYKFEYDREWLSIMKATNSLISFERRQPPLPEEAETQKLVMENKQWIYKKFPDGNPSIPHNFKKTAPAHDFLKPIQDNSEYLQPYLNPQTVDLCNMIEIVNLFNPKGKNNSEIKLEVNKEFLRENFQNDKPTHNVQNNGEVSKPQI